jgi:hypothetical protein
VSYTVGDGPPDLTAIHGWAPATGDPPPEINQQGGTNPPTMPWVRLLGITGWRSLPENEDLREARTFGDGEIVYPSRLLGKTIVYELRMVAQTVQDVQRTMTGVQRGFGDMNAEGVMTVAPLASFGGGVVWTYRARVMDFEPTPLWEFWPHRYEQFTWEAALTLRMSDPYFYVDGVGYL